MDKTYSPNTVEGKIYQMWEKGGYFTPRITRGKLPFSILLPLPNANDPMHMGHALFTVEDIMIRYHRMKGDPTLWLPGGDHAGIETQFVFEKHLGKLGKSRFDFDRETLHRMIAEFVEKNKTINRDQMKRLGFSLDFTRYHYSLEPHIVSIVLQTFKKLYDDGLVYRAERLVNYCTKCGTAFSDLEINHEERQDILYVLDYGPIKIATARPETIFADVAVAVNPKDKRYKDLIGKQATIPIINKSIPIITSELIDIKFGTGALKVTPAHDFTDAQIGQAHSLPTIFCIDRNGRLVNVPEAYLGLTVSSGRKAVVEDLRNQGKLIQETAHTHTVSLCYRCNTIIEPLLLPQWYVKTKPLAEPAIKAVKTGKTKIVPLKRFEKIYFDWMEHIEDWNISRQVVWGPRIPAWYCLDCNPDISIHFIDKNERKVFGEYQNLLSRYTFEEIQNGLQSLSAPITSKFSLNESPCKICEGAHILQETDTFDTWFLSGQWPITTLGYPNGEDFKYFYPTSVLDTLWDILFFWVARMMMLGLYLTGDVPFKIIHLHARVVDKHGSKMSKSKNNVINPIPMVEKYGADALRMALVYGVAPGSDICMSEEKIRGMRNFANKLWNIARFIIMNLEIPNPKSQSASWRTNKYQISNIQIINKKNGEDKKIIEELNQLVKIVTKYIDHYRFSDATQELYEFTWHRFADKYIELSKERMRQGDKEVLHTLLYVLSTLLKLLHPFMPFVTEEIWSKIPKKDDTPLIVSSWPT